jgi:hypothetical protein
MQVVERPIKSARIDDPHRGSYNQNIKGIRVNCTCKKNVDVETLKLAVAFELYLEGYDTVVFNRTVKSGDNRVRVHVFARDTLGSCVAVYCIHRPEQAGQEHLQSVVCTIVDGVGDDCQIAIAIPINLMAAVSEIAEHVYRIYMVDEDGRVWLHDPSRHFSTNRLGGEMKAVNQSVEVHHPAKMQRLALDERIQYVV